MCCDSGAEVFRRWVDGARVVDTRSFVVHAHVCEIQPGENLLEAVAG